MKKLLLLIGTAGITNLLWISTSLAHCPLCTIGAGAAALGASWLGLSSFSVGIFLGAFALAIGLWMGRILPQKIPHQDFLIGLISFLTTILPLQHLFYDNTSVLVSLYGDFGTWLNTAYVIDKYILGSILGAILLLIAPALSKKLSQKRAGKTFPYQGLSITFFLLLTSSIIFEISRWITF